MYACQRDAHSVIDYIDNTVRSWSQGKTLHQYLSEHEIIYHDRSLMIAPHISVIIPGILQVLHSRIIYMGCQRDVQFVLESDHAENTIKSLF